MNTNSIQSTLKEYSILTIGTIVLDIGVYVFKFPNNFTFGGVTGISLILSKIFPISASNFNLIINLALLFLGFAFLGKAFATKTVYISLLSSFLLSGMERYLPLNKALTDEPVLELFFAIILPAVSSAIFFNMNASGGGTDIIAMILKKKTHLNIGSALFIVDLIIVTASCFVFNIKTALFSFIGLMAKTLVVDTTIENVNLCKYFTIITDSPNDIVEFINTQLVKGATLFEAKGSFSQEKKYVILTVLRRGQAVELRNYIKQTHKNDTFLMITNSSEIIGKGFRGLN